MSPKDTLNKYTSLVMEGVNITRVAQEGNAVYWGNDDHLETVFVRYQLWRASIKEFLTETNSDTIEWHKFYEANGIPDMKGGPEYSDIQSDKSQTLLKNIRIETSNTLELLDKLGTSLYNTKHLGSPIHNADIVEVKGAKNYFSFNINTGSTVLNKTKKSFPPGQKKFQMLKVLVLAEEHNASYADICTALKIKNNKDTRRDIQGLMKEIKEDLQILPATKKSNPDVFINIRSNGYRIVIE